MANGRQTDYCHWPENLFTETEPEKKIEPDHWLKMAQIEWEERRMRKSTFIIFDEASNINETDFKSIFAGKKDEVVLHQILERARYQCECDGIICKGHKGKCQTNHVKFGGKSPLLLQPKDPKKAHSMENSKAMCAACATANSINLFNLDKKKKKAMQDKNQISIV